MRSQSRELALQILFQIEFAPQINFADFLSLFETSFSEEVISYAELLIEGVQQNREKLDEEIKSIAKNWSLDRMAAVDRNILRLSVFEMKWMTPTLAPKIVMNEAIELAKKYGTTDSGSFVNGVLDKVAQRISN